MGIRLRGPASNAAGTGLEKKVTPGGAGKGCIRSSGAYAIRAPRRLIATDQLEHEYIVGPD
jgi:hypothetical protein